MAVSSHRAAQPFHHYLLLALLLCSVTHTAHADGWDILKDVGNALGQTSEQIKEKIGLGETTDKNGVKQDSTLGSVLEGAAVCGGIAVMMGKKRSTTTKAAAACGAANGVLTALANSGRKDYAEKYRAITEDMAASEQEIASLQNQTATNDRRAKTSKRKIATLVKQEKDDRRFLNKADQMRNDLDVNIRDARRSKSIAQDKIHIIDGQISELDEIIKSSPNVKDIEKTRIALVDQRSRLVKAVKASNNVEKELVAQKRQLDNEIIERG